MRMVRTIFVLLGALAMNVEFCWAELVTFRYEAEEISGSGIVTGLFVFDTEATDDFPGNEAFALYRQAGMWSGDIVGGELDDSSFRFKDLDVTIFNSQDPAFDSLTMNVGQSNVLLSDGNGTAFESDDLPRKLLLDSFTSASLLINISDIDNNQVGPGGGQTVLYRLTSIEAIPEPSIGITVMFTFCGLMSRRRFELASRRR